MEQEPARKPESSPTRKLGQYTLLKKLGQGGMGAVFLAEDSMLLRQVAIKILPKKLAANQEFLARFKREAQAAGKLRHAHIVGAYAVGEEGGIPYYVMEFCPGESLEGVLKRAGRLPWQEAVELAKQVAEGLGYAHVQGLLHRDIKPANILVTPDHQAKILDLGLAKQVGEDASSGFQTLTGMAVGTPHYIAPEQARGEKNLDGRADIYSLGATLYHLITGRTPFLASTSPAIMAMHLTAEPPSPGSLVPGLPDALLQILAKMMAKVPAERYANCGQLIEDLEAAQAGNAPPHAPRVAFRPGGRGAAQGRGITTGPRSPVGRREEEVQPHEPPAFKKPGIPIGVLAGVVIVVLGLFLYLGSGRTPEELASKKSPAAKAAPQQVSPAPLKTQGAEWPLPSRVPVPALQPTPDSATPHPPAIPGPAFMEPGERTKSAETPFPATHAPSSTAATAPAPASPLAPTQLATNVPPAVPPTQPVTVAQTETVPASPAIPAPATPPKAVLRLRTALDWALSDEPFAQTEAKIRADLEQAEPSEKEACEHLAQLLRLAAAVPQAALQHVRNAAGGKLKVWLQEGGSRLMAVEKDEKDTLWVDYGTGRHAFKLEELTPDMILGFAKQTLGTGKEAGERLAAQAVLRGDVDTARRQINFLPPEEKGIAEKLLEERTRKVLEARAVEETAKFTALVAQQKNKEAIALGEQILKSFTNTSALENLQPPMDEQLEDLRARLAGLKGVFLCDYKKLLDGRVQLDFDFNKPAHCLELLNRSLAVYFTEIEADMSLQNDSRWHRIFHLGEATLTHFQVGGQQIEYDKKKEFQKGQLPTGGTQQAHGPGADRRYRLKANLQGITFQIDDERPQYWNIPWKGGRIKWPSHNSVTPEKMTITGRLDPRWLSEMGEVAADRGLFQAPGGAFVPIKPKARAIPRTDPEPWFDSYSFVVNPDLETRTIVGWNEIGPSWTLDKIEFVSPNPPKEHTAWTSWFWPAALTSAFAELAFEAQVEKGGVEIRLPTILENRSMVNWQWLEMLVIEKDSVHLETVYFFGGSPFRQEKDLQEKVRKPIPPAKPGKWMQIQVMNRKDAVQVFVDGQQVLDFKRPSNDKMTMAFLAHPRNSYRIRNVKIRKLE